jgi:hypothetical protein
MVERANAGVAFTFFSCPYYIYRSSMSDSEVKIIGSCMILVVEVGVVCDGMLTLHVRVGR